MDTPRKRVRELGISPGVLPAGEWNAITDVRGVNVGHVTLIEGDDIRTGVTAILPHNGNIFQEKVPTGIVVGNGFGKLIGFTQVEELGEIETAIVLTNTLAVPRAAEALIDWTLAQVGNEDLRSVNPSCWRNERWSFE
jgi:D-aminopeptidase